MKGPIKFKAWIPDIKCMYQVKSIDTAPEDGKIQRVVVWEHPSLQSAIIKNKIGTYNIKSDNGDEIDILQYIGVKDIDGIEVYQGDVLKIWHKNKPEETLNGLVWKFDGDYPAFDIYIKSERNDKGFEAFSDEFNGLSLTDFRIKIIGNNYEQPELLSLNPKFIY